MRKRADPAGQRRLHAMVQWAMFYVIIFSLAAMLLVVAGLTALSRRRRNRAAEETQGSPTHAPRAPQGTHADSAHRRTRKAKRSQSQHDRRKRH